MSFSTKLQLLRYYVLALNISLKASIFPLRCLKKLTGTENETDKNMQPNEKHISTVLQLNNKIKKYSLWHYTCLHQSLVVKRILRNKGINCTLHLGILKNHHKLEAHAWLSVSDKVILGASQKPYTEVKRFS